MSATSWLSGKRRALLRQAHGSGAREAIPRLSQDAPLRLSPAQQRIWLLDQLSSDSGLYNVSIGLWLRGVLDTDVLADAFRAAVGRHEVLRSTFRPDRTGKLLSTVSEEAPELTVSEVGGGEAGTMAVAEELARGPIDVQSGPVLRGTLLRSDPHEHLLVVVAHHLVADGTAMEVLLRDLVSAYRAGGGPLPAPAVQYADYAAWQLNRVATGDYDGQLSYWQERLRGASTVSVPTDRPRPARPTFAGAWTSSRIGRETVTRLESLMSRHRATPFMVATALYAGALARWSNETDLVIGAPLSGRNRAELADVAGCFVNMVPLRLDLAGSPTFGQTLERVRDVVIEAQENGEVPFDHVVKALRPERSASGQLPLIRHIVQYSAEPELPTMDDLELELRPFVSAMSKFDCFVEAVDLGADGWEFRVNYSAEMFDATSIDRLLADIRSAAEDAERP